MTDPWIDRGVFLNEWTLLCERFRLMGEKAPSTAMRRRYWAYLSARLTTDSFQRACEKLYAEREFFPRPVDFIEAAGGGEERAAEDDWLLCQRVMEGEPGAAAQMSPAGREALRRMGGYDRLRMTPPDQVEWRRKRFLELHETLRTDPELPALPAATSESRAAIASLGPIRLLGGTP